MAHSPQLGGKPSAQFPLQFPTAKIGSVSMASTPIHQFANDGSGDIMSHGTGFFWRYENSIYLITARHVLTGLSPFDDSVLSDKGYIPEQFAIFPTKHTPDNAVFRVQHRFQLDHSRTAVWLQDPEFELLRTDIAALKVFTDTDQDVICLNDDKDLFNDQMALAGMPCAVVGYPLPNPVGLMTPVWRTGNLASEPLLPIDDKPMFLMDASTSPGFSGSPVFRRHYGPLPIQKQDGSITVKVDNVVATSFIGVYAGRLSHRHFGGEVPFVFYGNRIPTILAQDNS